MSAKGKQSFDELMKTIEERVKKLQDPQTSLEESLTLYEETSRLIAAAKERLGQMEHKFETIQARVDAPTAEPEVGDESAA